MSRLCITNVYGIRVNVEYDFVDDEVTINGVTIGEDDQDMFEFLDQSFLSKCESACYDEAVGDDGSENHADWLCRRDREECDD